MCTGHFHTYTERAQHSDSETDLQSVTVVLVVVCPGNSGPVLWLDSETKVLGVQPRVKEQSVVRTCNTGQHHQVVSGSHAIKQRAKRVALYTRTGVLAIFTNLNLQACCLPGGNGLVG